MSKIIDITVPDIGGSENVSVIEIYVKVGDVIKVDDNLIMLETDKATMEVPSNAAGIVKQVTLKVGDKVSQGSLILRLEEASNKLEEKIVLPEIKEERLEAPTTTEVSAAKTTTSSKIIDVNVPDIGGSENVSVIEVYVKVGDTIKVNDNLIMLETDKATMEVPSSAAGVVTFVAIKTGDKVSQGSLIIKLQANEEVSINEVKALEMPVEEKKLEIKTEEPPKVVAPQNIHSRENNIIDETSFAKAFASPSIRKLARELGVNLGNVKGSGRASRIVEDDVKGFVKSVMNGQISLQGSTQPNGSQLDLLPWPKIDFSKFGEVEKIELSRIKKLSKANLSRNWVMIPHVTQFDDADITSLEEFRKSLNSEMAKQNIKVTPLAFLIKACVFALKKFPEFNSSLDGDNVVFKKYFNIGFAADTPNGLVVPVLKDADKKGIVEIAVETSELAKLAREGKLKASDMQGGCFTISSLGGVGGTAFTPIINAPEVAILGVSKSSIKPVWDGSKFEPRMVLPLSLSYDHRVIDGALAARFTTYLSQLLSDIRRLSL